MRLKTADLSKVKIQDVFWSKYIRLVPKEVLTYQWAVLNDAMEGAEPSHAIRNFRIAAGQEKGDFYGFVFQDSDLAKWLEAAAFTLAWEKDPELEKHVDEAIDLIGEAQRPDGYLDTYFIIREEGREFTNLREGHELYCAGHLIEAGVAYYKVSGKRKLLDICCRMADHIVEAFHQPPLERAIPGHEEIELALVKLYEVTGKEAYLTMAKEFIDRRGQKPHYFFEETKRPGWKQIFGSHFGDGGYYLDYAQTDEPVRIQKTARGHAVRAVYLYSAMADVAAYTKDQELLKTCETLYENIVNRQMYITGGIGSSGILERFTVDYDLPNAMNYAESCASIGLAMFCRRMAQATGEARYMDTAETALCNTVLAGIAMDGKSFFYVNPLAVWPAACIPGTSREHVKPVRQKWFGCACCPPNIARTLASLGEYCFFEEENGFRVNLYVSGTSRHRLGDREVELTVRTDYPFDGKVELTLRRAETIINEEKDIDVQKGRILLRIPAWAKKYSLRKNNRSIQTILEKGYAVIEGSFADGDTFILELDMPAEYVRANPAVRADAGRVAVRKGPLVYCLEQQDNGTNLEQLIVDPEEPLREIWCEDILKGTLVLEGKGYRAHMPEFDENTLYAPAAVTYEETPLHFVPYPYWGNRTPGEMLVWARSRERIGTV